MDSLNEVFNNRELATILWIIAFFIIFLFVKRVRASLTIFIKAILNKYVLISYAIVFLYIALQVLLFYKVKYWDISLLKDTIFWVLGWAVVAIVNINDKKRKPHLFKKLLLDILKVTVILEFILNLYTFSFITEMIVMPCITLLASSLNTPTVRSRDEVHPASCEV